ncbi:hypothetical protein CXF59_07205 [Flavobacterium sp. ALD4]|uniref:glycosyltransferase family 2 protein n=1 Tax=Flavobacterium sp. ALD4 TaxID=2058314 RepID=UPI000C33C8D7|nr:glycosyltransferase family 2 protein [Flavobacterium sp. ALD4]PKH67686.1 hypothetical protein CXF59_07205 [Flavobacterium sp. ALD4]
MKKNKKLISFLITHYNRPLDLMECLEGIEKIQISDYEIVVSDDGSEVENIKLLQGYKINKLILSKTNQGLAANINKGIEACEGKYIIYCQEDFILNSDICTILPECFALLNNQKADMIRFSASYSFKKLIGISENIFLIPKFSFRNFLLNANQYSDHPFITTKKFYDTFGYYLENTSGDYGETEYAIRIFNSKAKIAILANKFVKQVEGSQSVMGRELDLNSVKLKLNKSLYKFARAFRLHFEFLFYNQASRGLITYKNYRDKSKVNNTGSNED